MKQKVCVNVNWEAVLNRVCKGCAIIAGTFTACAITNAAWKPNTVFGKVADVLVTSVTGVVIGCGYGLVLDKVYGTHCMTFNEDMIVWEVETYATDSEYVEV